VKYLYRSIISSLLLFSSLSQSETLFYSAPPNSAPFSDHIDGEIRGLCQILVEAFAANQGIQVKAKVLPWKRAQVAAEKGELDLICAIYKNADRLYYLDFTQAFSAEYVGLFHSSRRPLKYSGWSSLIDQRGATTIGDSWGIALDQYMQEELQVIRLADLKQTMRMLVSGRINYVITGLYQGAATVNSLKPLTDDITVASRNLNSEDIFMAFSKKSHFSALLPRLNQWLEREETQRLIESELKQFEAGLFD